MRMSTLFILSALSTAAAIAAVSSSFAGNGQNLGHFATPALSGVQVYRAPATKIPAMQFFPYTFNCRVQGSPVEFPDDLMVWNTSGYTVPHGTKVKWRVNGSQIAGVATLPQMAPGAGVSLSNVLGNGMSGGTCTITKA